MKRIAIVAGGYSSESVVSLKSAEALYSFMNRKMYHLYLVLITKEKWVVQMEDKILVDINKNDFSFRFNDQRISFDFVYITIHGAPGEDGLLQGYLELLGIPYSGCGVLSSSLTINKYYCNNYLRGFGVKTAKSICLKQTKKKEMFFEQVAAEFEFPVFVKPNCGGSSIGATKVNTILELQSSIILAFKEADEILIESFIPGKEVTCGCYKAGNKSVVFPITEIIPRNVFFDFNDKYDLNGAEEITPARISKEMTNKIQALTWSIYEWIGAKGIIRIDYIISPGNEIHFLEVNTVPGMTATSFIPKQIRAAGLNIQDVLTEIIESS